MVQDKYTPLHLAAMNGHSETVQLLLTAKGNVNAEDRVSASFLRIMMELCDAEPYGLDWCSTSKPRYSMPNGVGTPTASRF